MDHTRGDGQVVFTSHAWRRMFEIHGPLVLELMLEFFSTCRFSDTELGLDVVDTFCFQLGGLRRQMNWRQFILALGLHTAEEMGTDDFGAYWADSLREIATKADLRDYWSNISFDEDFLSIVPSYISIRDPLRRLCHRLITFNISRRGQAPEKVTATNLFYLRSMDKGTVVDPEVAQDGVQADMAPAAPAHAPPAALVLKTITQRLQRLEEEMHEVRESLGEHREVIDRVSTNFARFSAWVAGGLG
ncbi:hypothetical protein Tco_1416191 [Tanacetum coccineum]